MYVYLSSSLCKYVMGYTEVGMCAILSDNNQRNVIAIEPRERAISGIFAFNF